MLNNILLFHLQLSTIFLYFYFSLTSLDKFKVEISYSYISKNRFKHGFNAIYLQIDLSMMLRITCIHELTKNQYNCEIFSY